MSDRNLRESQPWQNNWQRFFQTRWVPEYARSYLDSLGRPYESTDLLEIAKGQLDWEQEYEAGAQDLLICDTNLLVIKIWSEVKCQSCDPWILEHMQLDSYLIHLLTAPDIPWEFDPQREHPEQREELFLVYKAELTRANVPFEIIRGNQTERFDLAKRIIEEEISKFKR